MLRRIDQWITRHVLRRCFNLCVICGSFIYGRPAWHNGWAVHRGGCAWAARQQLHRTPHGGYL